MTRKKTYGGVVDPCSCGISRLACEAQRPAAHRARMQQRDQLTLHDFGRLNL